MLLLLLLLLMIILATKSSQVYLAPQDTCLATEFTGHLTQVIKKLLYIIINFYAHINILNNIISLLILWSKFLS